MKKKDVINLIKYYAEKDSKAFRNEAMNICRYFDSICDYELAEAIMDLLSTDNIFTENLGWVDNLLELSNHPKKLYQISSPVIIGQEVYIISRNKIKTGFVRYIGIGKFIEFNAMFGKFPNNFKIYRFTEKDIGSIVFLDKKDANRSL